MEKLKCHGIYHSFRLPETRTKPLCKDMETKKTVGMGACIEAWKFNDRDFWTLSELAQYFIGNKRLSKIFSTKVLMELERGGRAHNPLRMTRAQALKNTESFWHRARRRNTGLQTGRFMTAGLSVCVIQLREV